jgi:aryl-alcohol dehydrogenase-like predicted oxidoreductase
MTWEDSLGNMRILDRWRKSVGLVFDAEKGDALKATVSKQPLKARPGCNMHYIELPGLEKKISQLVMGTMIFSPDDMPFACAMFDNFVERGGNCFDTAYVYGGGNSEPALGEWMRLRGNRDDLVVIGKGAHTPNCNVESLTRELNETLERLGTDYLDIYLLHRDDPGVPVSEFVDCLIEHVEAGRIRLFGGSNWTIERIAEAREYARSRGRIGFTVSSSNLCMATWNEPMWAGSISASDARSRAWHEKSQTALFAWSSQANGFFSGRFSPEDRSDSDMVRVWYGDDNFRRMERARELGEKKGVAAFQIAVAYVLGQPFPTFSLIGPRTIEEMRTSAGGLDVSLSPEEMRWLMLED